LHGRHSIRITPTFWSADELAKRLGEVLSAEGYSSSVGFNAGPVAPIVILPVSAINTVIIFAADQSILDHASKWAADLDSPAKGGAGNGYFTYQVKYTDADVLAGTLRDVISGQAAASTATPATAVGGQQPAATPTRASTRVVVDKATNSLIFQGNAEEYTQWIGLLKDLDRPVKSALVEVTVAEVTLTDTTSLGVEWSLANVHSNSGTYTTSFQAPTTSSGSSSSSSSSASITAPGLTITRLIGSTPRATLTALAAGTKLRVLSSPRIVARNGEMATIEVGNQVPIITSQQSNANTGGTAGVLQTVEYKDTGVILKVKPIIYAGGRVELEVTQEVSGASATQTGVNISPTISTRKINTRLSLRDGASVMLGGMISSSNNAGNAGIPLLKDIPVLGQLFRNSTTEQDRTELIIMITPYVINDDYEAEELTNAFRNQLGAWAGEPKADATTPDVASKQDRVQRPAKSPIEPRDTSSESVHDKEAPIQNGGEPPAETLPDAPEPQMPETPAAAAVPGAGAPNGNPPGVPAGQAGRTVVDPEILKEIEQAQKR
jgi:general secretion pathway protein D